MLYNSRQCLLGETLVLYYKCITAPRRQKPDNQLIHIENTTSREVRVVY